MKKTTKVTMMSIALAAAVLSGCGSAQTTSANPPSSTSSNSTAQASSSNAGTQANSSEQVVNLEIKPASKVGPDGKKHDSFVTTDFTVTKGKPVKLVITNYDKNMHTLTSGDLNLNLVINGATSGSPTVTNGTFTPDKTGTFHWACMNPCDMSNSEWSMTHQGFMQGTITVNS